MNVLSKSSVPCLALVLALGLASGPSMGCARKPASAGQEQLTVRSPDGSIEVEVTTTGPLAYGVNVDHQPILAGSRLGLRFADGTELGSDALLETSERASVDASWENPLGKRRQVRDQHNELRLALRERGSGRRFGVVFRVFNDGVGFRYSLPAAPDRKRFVLAEEQTRFAFAGDYFCYAGQNETKGFTGPQEWEFKRQQLSDLPAATVVGLPLLVETPAAWVAVAEADLYDWSGMWLSRCAAAGGGPAGGVTLGVRLAPRSDGQGLVVATAPHDSPWRVLLIGRQPGRLIESDLVLNLSTPCRLDDTSWIKPGLMAWDRWWSGVGKMDTASLQDFIALAGEMGWPYQLVDAGWYQRSGSAGGNITNINPAVDMGELRRFASRQGVRLWVWLHWRDVARDDAYTNAFALYEQAGLAGVKIDFMDRDDQEMVNWYEKIVRAAAAHHLLVDFHGAYKPTGMIRTYPNQITREGVLGNEYNKWSARVTPEHKLTLPFTRFLLGPGDFTPGGFVNRQPSQFRGGAQPTQVQGTRASELALFVVYDSPVACVCDHPSHYRGQMGADFLQSVPTVWDETRVLDGVVGEHLVMARRSGDSWYLGALTDRHARRIPVRLDFLDPGQWKLTMWKDASDSDTNAENLIEEESVVTPGDSLLLELAPAGGAVAKLEKD